MSRALVVQFQKQFASGFRLRCTWSQPVDRFFVTVLFGPSGCGKTTALRCLAGLDCPESGHILYGDACWFDHEQKTCLPPQERSIGFLFQDYALFPHLTVAQNILFGVPRTSNAQRRETLEHVQSLLQIAGLEDRYPRQLSGGQQQRVALARALVRRPCLLLLDEPLAALDGVTRAQLRPALRRMLSEAGIPTVIVTHDRDEALTFADQMVVMDQGEQRQVGSVQEVFAKPQDLVVAQLAGVETIVRGSVQQIDSGMASVNVGTSILRAMTDVDLHGNVYVCIRGEDIILQPSSDHHGSARNSLAATVMNIEPQGVLLRVELDVGFPLIALITRSACDELQLERGSRVTALVKAQSVHLIQRD